MRNDSQVNLGLFFHKFFFFRRFYNLTVRATNMASASSTCSAIVHVLDRNDNAPYFMKQLYMGEISESAPIASLILTVNDTYNLKQRFVT